MRINLIELKKQQKGNVTVAGWVNRLRVHSKIAFIEVRDKTAVLQVVIDPGIIPRGMSLESLVEITGHVSERTTQNINPDQFLGKIELKAKNCEIISSSKELPFQINTNTLGIDESMRLKYRYLDLRSQRMRSNLILRHDLARELREYFNQRDFIEVETPALTKGTPEGAREFMVPSRLHEGSGYVLPQSPQQFKQLLMVGGIERYYQFARCFRDEDSRKDRQPEFTQFDLEVSFLNQNEIMQLIEDAIKRSISKVLPYKEIPGQFPVFTYEEVMKQYGSDKPDLRKNKNNPNELAFCWVIDFPLFERDTDTKKINATHHPFTAPNIISDKELEQSEEKLLKIKASAYDLVLNGYEIGGGSVRIADPVLQRKIFHILGLSTEEVNQKFGHILEAFEFAPPPHGGFAIGFDRLVAVLAGEPSIREVIAFPKTGESRDLLTGSPTPLLESALLEVGLKSIIKKSKKIEG